MEGFNDVIIGSGGQGVDLFGAARCRSQHDYPGVGQGRVRAQPGQHIAPAEAGHAHVHHNQVNRVLAGRRFPAQDFHRLPAVARPADLVPALTGQIRGYRINDLGIIVNDENVEVGHGGTDDPPRSAAIGRCFPFLAGSEGIAVSLHRANVARLPGFGLNLLPQVLDVRANQLGTARVFGIVPHILQ